MPAGPSSVRSLPPSQRLPLAVPLAVFVSLLFPALSALGHGEVTAPPPAPAPAPPPAPAAGTPGATKSTPAWDVMKPPGPVSEVRLDTDEGTWMSLDISPDGKELVFDLLGDLYVLPITGGEAKPLTRGIAWDMQPRYSPDGKFIAFTSDRSGGDNLWVMNRDGSAPKAVSQEDFRLVNAPTWTPDGLYIAGRKHFTAERSLGSGEIWLYHRSGGAGVPMTSKPNDQQDVGEPAFSPNGRFLYYSQDTTPGGHFEYNKDPNKGIYSILRLDRETGETIPLISGPGGAIRPTPSPDGKSLAFIRRVRAKSVLLVRDLESGVERTLTDGLDRDLQETWAIHGVYPTLAWTPDGKSLIYWAGGKLMRIETATRLITPIPFHVQDTRTVVGALRFPQKVAPESFPARMIRQPTFSPDGKQLVFQALGTLWIKDLPDGTPRRLTKQSEHWELYPSFSRDGKSLVYMSWQDQALGALRMLSLPSGESKLLTSKPGYYLEPVVSPDGSRLVYRRAGGGYLSSPTWSQDPGIWVQTLQAGVPVGAPTRVVIDGLSPHFGASSSRIFFLREGKEGKLSLFSIDLDGSDEREVFTSEKAMEIRVSPDEQWVAFQEHFNAYVAPFPRIGRTIELGPKMTSLPVRKVSKDAGSYLTWSGDSSRLSWLLGPELTQVELKDAFAFLSGSAPLGEPAKPEGDKPSAASVQVLPSTRTLAIGLTQKSDVPPGVLALTGARILTMRGEEIIEDGAILIRGNRIEAIGKREDVVIPQGVIQLDVRGTTILPGLIDVHAHGGQGFHGIIPQQSWLSLAQLAFGVTTLHDPSNDTDTVFAASEMQRAGLIPGPRLFSTGTILYGAKAPFKAEIDSYEDALMHLTRMKAVGAFSVKSYNQPRRNQRQMVIEAARSTQMMVVPEGGSLFQHNMTQVVDGHTGIEHAVPLARLYKDVKQLWAGTQVGYTPTLGVAYGGLMGEEYWYQQTDVFNHPRLTRFVPLNTLDARARRRGMVPSDEFGHVWTAKATRELLESGVKVQLGAHGQREGLAAHWELWMMVQGGMTPFQALRAGTLAGAQYLGLDGELGSLEPGKLADLVVVDGNPLQDIRQSEKVRYTVVNGHLYDAATMDELGNRPRRRAPLYWEPQP